MCHPWANTRRPFQFFSKSQRYTGRPGSSQGVVRRGPGDPRAGFSQLRNRVGSSVVVQVAGESVTTTLAKARPFEWHPSLAPVQASCPVERANTRRNPLVTAGPSGTPAERSPVWCGLSHSTTSVVFVRPLGSPEEGPSASRKAARPVSCSHFRKRSPHLSE